MPTYFSFELVLESLMLKFIYWAILLIIEIKWLPYQVTTTYKSISSRYLNPIFLFAHGSLKIIVAIARKYCITFFDIVTLIIISILLLLLIWINLGILLFLILIILFIWWNFIILLWFGLFYLIIWYIIHVYIWYFLIFGHRFLLVQIIYFR